MLLDEYPPGPCLIVADTDGQAAAIIAINWPHGLIDALAVFTCSDTPRVELVIPAWLRPADGDGAICPCGGDRSCAGCGGTGVYRGTSDAVIVYPLTPLGPDGCVAFTGKGPRPMTVVGGFVPRCFDLALERRAETGLAPVGLVLEAVGLMPDVKVRML